METISTFADARILLPGRKLPTRERIRRLADPSILIPAPRLVRREKPSMLAILVFVLIAMWAFGFFGGYVMGGLIHILLVVALIAVVFHFAGRRTA